jgi:hypothetical protein
MYIPSLDRPILGENGTYKESDKKSTDDETCKILNEAIGHADYTPTKSDERNHSLKLEPFDEDRGGKLPLSATDPE